MVDMPETILEFDSLIHLQDSQTSDTLHSSLLQFDSLIHLQDSQTTANTE